MGIYRRDYKLESAKKLIDNLKETEENNLIKYYIENKDQTIQDQRKEIEKYRNFFSTLNRLLPKNIKLG